MRASVIAELAPSLRDPGVAFSREAPRGPGLNVARHAILYVHVLDVYRAPNRDNDEDFGARLSKQVTNLWARF